MSGIREWLTDDPECPDYVTGEVTAMEEDQPIALVFDEAGAIVPPVPPVYVEFTVHDGADVAEVFKRVETGEDEEQVLESIRRIRRVLDFVERNLCRLRKLPIRPSTTF